MMNQTKPATSSPATKFFSAHGRRKEAAARVRLFKGQGETLVNNQPIEKYFPGEVYRARYTKPFIITKTEGKYYATIKVEGSGKSSQVDAVIHGLARVLVIADPQTKPIIKKAGLLTRDPRAKERRKAGRAQKARKGKQSPKR